MMPALDGVSHREICTNTFRDQFQQHMAIDLNAHTRKFSNVVRHTC